MFILGLALFSAASAACGLAPSSGVLIGARALQGIGGAMLYPQVLAIVQLTFVGDARTRALGIFGSVAGLAAVAGQVPHESDRLPIIRAQVDEMRRRQAAGLLPDDIDPSLLRLFAFALASYPRMLPQITRMTTGLAPDDPRFVAAWEKLLRRVGTQLERSNGVPTAFQPPTAGSSSVFS